ncbi:MAG TPA: glycosyltransferase family 4 protein [Gemmatimonadaceae bacterium]
MKAVAIVTGDFVRTGGMDVANFHLARHLARAAEEVHLVAHRVDDELLALPTVHWHRVAKPLGSYLLGAGALARAGRRWSRVLAARGGRTIVNGGNCVSPDTNWVHYVHAGHQPAIATSTVRRILGGWKHARYVAEEREALRAARLVIVNSNATGREITGGLGVPAARVHTVYYGTDASYHRPPTAEERTEARDALGWHDARPGVAFVGALGDRRKGFDLLFAAWSRLCEDPGWDSRLTVVGTGNELPAWRRAAASAGLGDRIQFVGFTRDVRRVLWACDAIAAPARYEAYGLAVHEAVCCGLPAIVNPEAGVAERLAGLEGLQPERPGDAAALATALRRWRSDRDTWADAARRASTALRAWSWDDMAARIVGLMEEAA